MDHLTSDKKISIPQVGYEPICQIIVAYTLYKNSASNDDIASTYNIRKVAVSLTNGFLIDIGVIQGGKGEEKRIITEKGERLGKALKYYPDDVKDAWAEIIQGSQFFHALLQKLSSKKKFFTRRNTWSDISAL